MSAVLEVSDKAHLLRLKQVDGDVVGSCAKEADKLGGGRASLYQSRWRLTAEFRIGRDPNALVAGFITAGE